MQKDQKLDTSSLDDISLLALIVRGHSSYPTDPAYEEAVSILYDRYGRLVYTMAIKVVNDVELAEEITQDVFVKACDNAHTYRPEIARISSWLIGITRNRAIDELRRQKAHPDRNNIPWPDEAESAEFKVSAADGPEALAENNIRQQNISRILSSLPADQQKVLGLAFYRGLSHSQIASTLGEPLGTVKSRIRLAMEKIQGVLSERGKDDF